MAIINAAPALTALKKKTDGLVYAMNGTNPAFNQTQSPVQSALPQNYTFDDLAKYEQQARNAYGQTASADILGTRDSLAKSLGEQGQQFFQQQNPALLEDLNSRGLLTSQSEVAKQEAQALKQINLQNQSYLRDFDTSALSARLQAGQDALDTGSNLRSSGLEQANANAQSDKEQSLAEKLAAQQGRNQLNGALIGAGGSLLGAALPSLLAKKAGTTIATDVAGKALAGGLGSAGAGTLSATGQIVPGIGEVASFTPAGGAASGLGTAAGVGAIGAAGIGSAIASRAAEKKVGEAAGTTAGSAAAVLTNPIGAQINAAKKLVTNPGQAIKSVSSGLGIGAGKTASQQQAIDLGESQDAVVNPILQNINSKKNVGTFNEGQFDAGIKGYDQLKAALNQGQITQEQFVNAAGSFLPQLFQYVQVMGGSGSAGASAVHNFAVQLTNQMNDYKNITSRVGVA